MPAKSRSQQRLMGMVHAYQSGKLNLNDISSSALRDKVKKIAGGIKSDDSKKFAKTKHKGLPEVKESNKPTFKEYLVEMSQKEKEALVPPAAIQKLYMRLKQKNGIVKRDVFLNAMADTFRLTPQGLERMASLPSVRALPFDDDQQGNMPSRRDPWGHVKQKHSSRSEADANRSMGGRPKPMSDEKQDILRRLGA